MKLMNKQEVIDEMLEDIESLTNENYHTEAGYLEEQMNALERVHLDSSFNYFSWSAADDGLRECLIV